VVACEVLIKSPTIEGYILKNELEKIPDAIASSGDYYKMQTMNQALEKLITAKTVTLEEALKSTSKPSDLKLRVGSYAQEIAPELEHGEEGTKRTRFA
jgi:Tfp pilus assembly ATPase PilU